MFDYKFHAGSWAWLFHRISGLALIFYLCLHVWVVHFLAESPETFNKLMEFLSSPLFKLAEVALLAAILYHGINGLRVILVEWLWGNLNHKLMFYAIFGVCAVLTFLGFLYLVVFPH